MILTMMVSTAIAIGPSVPYGSDAVPTMTMPCQTYVITDDAKATSLLDMGWRGVQSDHLDALYSPACQGGN